MNRYKAIFVKRIFVLMLAVLPCVAAMAQAPTPTRPSVKGAVFGGGRMADVNGETNVDVKECQAIGSVFGGNDIAGQVLGANGAKVTIGSGEKTSDILIGSVYGGGNGYYYYPNGVGTEVFELNGSGDPVAKTLAAGDVKGYTTADRATVYATLTGAASVPSVQRTTVSVVSDRVYIDSVFGGAKNAIVCGDADPAASDTTTSIRISHGTVFSVFGGNNYGGFLAKNTTQHIVVGGSKALAPTNSSVNLGGDHSTGLAHTGATIDAWTAVADAHSICFLFGGGNKVPGQNVHIEVFGGQIDTLFGGGNSADVASTTVDVNVTSPLYAMANSPYTDPTTYAYSTTTSVFDIRCLFGGNNAADMTGLPTLNLTKGGIHNVYGGGNKGVMLAADPYYDNYRIENLNPTNNANHKEGAKRSTNVLVNRADILIDTLYGGGQSAGTIHDTYVEVANGNVGVVYGGTNIMGRIGPAQDRPAGSLAPRDLAKTNVYIHGGTVHNTVFGASNGFYRCHNGLLYSEGDNNLFADANAYSYLAGRYTPAVFNSYVLITAGTIKGNVYSSGNMAVVGKPAAVAQSPVLDSAGIALLHISGGTIGVGVRNYNNTRDSITSKANVFGGGNMGCVFGAADVIISGSPVIYGDVYGGNDKTGRVFSPLRNGTVAEIRTASSAAQAAVSHSEYPGVHSSDLAQGASIPLTDNNAATYTLITGTPQIAGSVFGGGNGDYIYVDDYDGKATLISSGTPAERIVVNCSQPPSADERSSFVDINVDATGYINRVYGGGNSKTTGYATRGAGIVEQGTSYVYFNCTAAPTDDETNVNVGTIFGGNNKVEMNKVPRIVMLQGKVGNVYGGGNMGAMTGNEVIASLPLSTYVATPSDNVVVTQNIYGGCNVADVSNDTYVKITQGIVRGHIFGGNDMSGEVGISHVIIDGADGKELLIRGNVYGGGNGDYPFYLQERDGDGAYYTKSNGAKVYAHSDPLAAEGAVDGVANKYCYSHFEYFDLDGRPYVDSAAVVLNGEFTINGNVYGGGISGDCRKTNVLVDAEEGVFNGMIFGAGRGRVDNMGLRINGTCKELYIGVAQFDEATGKTKVDVSGNIVYGTGNAMGNVLDTAWLTVRQFKSMSGGRSAMFGGGQSGNVRNTMVTYENTAVNPLEALYLGCLASDVTGTATGVIDAYEPTNEHWIIDTLYGGNDFTGRVEHTRMIVNSGIFTHLFGAGNGDYNYDQWIATRPELNDDAADLAALAGGGCADTVPYSMDVNIDINGGEFLNTVYGGGNMGLVGDRDMVASNMTGSNDDRADYIGTITLNIHAGEFHRHVFTGARGKTDMEGSTFFGLAANGTAADGQTLGKQLAYAQKILNMDGGHVAFSVYGGSEAVDDGFPYECIGAANYASNPNQNTTLRPSTIMNITGGRIEKSVYGGGYQGNIYGSVYVNIGIDAVRDCPAWGKTFGNDSIAYYKPNLLDHSGYTMTNTLDGSNNVVKTYVPVTSRTNAGNTTLKRNVIDLEASVYNASDWGEAGTNAYFLTRGVFGGVTNILIDGKGYTTSINPINVEDPAMNINYSIIGAGTSTEGGDVNRLITLRHYGNYECPDPSKTLYSIQRADKVILDSVFIDLYGEQDAFSAYASPSYSLCRIDTIIFRVDNILMIESPGIYIGKWASLRTDEVYDIDNPNHLYDNIPVDQDVITEAVGETPAVYSTEPNDFFDNLYPQNVAGDCNTNQCTDIGPCLRLPTLRGTDKYTAARNVLMMRNGSYVRVSPFVDAHNNQTPTDETPDGLDDGNHDFGHVYGWMYLLAQDATMSYVYADTKMTANDGTRNSGDGGFISTCRCENLQTGFVNELPYTNVVASAISNEYRSWTIGTNQGSRVRHITLVANAVPDNRLNYNLGTESGTNYPLYIKDNDSQSGTINVTTAQDFAYATTTLELPPANGGNFYVINSVIIDQDNGGQLQLVDRAYENKDNIFFQTTSDASAANGLDKISADPDYTFGLAFASNENFDNTSCWNTDNPPADLWTVSAYGVQFTRNLTDNGAANGTRYACWEHSVISGNQYITNQGGYISNAIVGGAVGAIPTMKFTLTYNKNIHTTVTRDVIFTMFEFDQAGNFVGPVEVTVTISTVIKDFADLEAPVLAMYNEGITNEYVRKITIPASFQQRDIYITGIEWMKDTTAVDGDDGNHTVYESLQKKQWFNLEEYTGAIPNNNNHFSVIVKPTESASENINNTLGWYHIAHPDGVDVYKLAKDDYEETTHLTDFHTGLNNRRDSVYRSWDYTFEKRDSHYDPNVTAKVTNMGTEGHGYWLGTLDGRSTASIDVSLKFNGMWYYHKQFTPPLAWVRLRCKYINTKTTTPDNNEFWIYVKIRTRFQGDTIYMAPEPTLTRTAGTGAGAQTLMMHAYGYGYDESNPTLYPPDWQPDPGATPNYNLHDRATKREKITNNPNNYLQDFKQVMEIFDEGDVIDIMETIPIWKGDEPVTVMGDDYSIIQIIRYSGSHYKFPTLDCANYNPLVEVRGNGRLTMRNIWFNGSGCTRVKGDTNVAPNVLYDSEHAYSSVGGGSVEINGTYYYENHRRVNALLFAQSPIVYVHQHGEAAFTKNVIFSNNFNNNHDKYLTTNVNDPNYNQVYPNFIGGGAIALVNDNAPNAQGNTGSSPTVTLGDMGHIYDNLVVDWNAANATAPAITGGTHDWLPRNYGGGVYVDGGQFIVGGGDKGVDVQINRNFYLKSTSNNYGVQTKTAHMFSDVNSDIPISFDVYYLDTLNHAQAFSLSNVYLKRTPSDCGGTPLVRLDQQNDVVYFLSEMSSTSRIGISKWFPGYIYHNTRTEGSNFLDRRSIADETLRDRPRDTISIARIARGKSSNSMVDNNYAYGVFFNDSAYYSATGGTAAFTNSYPAVTYSRNTEAYPGYNDKVFVYRHTSLSPYIIYFQRCASFGKGIYQLEETNDCFNTQALNDRGLQFNNYIKGDSISYHWNSAATCALAMDTLKFRVGGGFFPYTYKWYNVSDTTYSVPGDPSSEYTVDRQLMHTRITTGSNAIARFGTAGDANEQLRKQAEFDTLVFRTEVSTSDNRHNYAFEAVATDLTGNCVVRQPVKIRTVKVATDHHDDGKFLYDYANFLQHRKKGGIAANATPEQIAAARAEELFYRIKSPGVDSSSFHDHKNFVPDHHLAVDGEAEEGGLRRAGYTHHTATEEAGDTFTGLPYAGNNTDAVGDMTPRYLRIFRSYRVKPSIYPEDARGSVAIYDVNDNLLEDLSAGNMSDDDYHPAFEVCPGEVLHLRPTVATGSWEFIGWDFDPSSPADANFVVTNQINENNPIIYYVPGDYWWQVVNKFENHTGAPTGIDATHTAANIATLDDYELDYYGNVTIKTEKGLAWLISTVNGYNQQNAQTFHFNTITLNKTDGKPFNMQAHKWTPLGNENNPFEGVFQGAASDTQHVSNILVNENTIVPAGMFGYTRGATIKNFVIDSTMVHCNGYISAVVGEATEGTVLQDLIIQRGAIFGEYVIGGFISHMVNSSLINCYLRSPRKAIGAASGTIGAFGNAVYAGGFVGHAQGVNTLRDYGMQNTGYINIRKLSAIYVGAIIGFNDATNAPVQQKSGKTESFTTLNNGYARLLTSNSSQRVGGLVGRAENIEINNSYVSGVLDYDKTQGYIGGLVGYMGDNVSISNCYYVDGMTDNPVGVNTSDFMPQKSTTFKGKGNQVMLTTPVDGYNNMTRALNAWVRDHGDTIYNTWRSDLDGVNNGFPLFGEPDLIPVNDTLVTSSCETFEFDGLTFDQSGAYVFHIIDSSDFVDSTLTLMLTINYGDTTEVSDTVDFGNGYVGNGFSLTPDDLRAAMSHGRTNEVMALQFIDSLQNANGCDSLVVLTLYVTGVTSTPEVQKLVDVKVYPNPTRSIVNVEGSDLKKVEVYDNVSRRILTKSVDGDRTTFDLSNQASGSYYVRISTAHGTVVKKVIKK